MTRTKHNHRRGTRAALALALTAGMALAGTVAAAGPASSAWQDRGQAGPAGGEAVPAAAPAPRDTGNLQMFATLAEFQDATAGWDLAFEDFSARPANSVSPCYEPVNSDLGQPGTNFLAPICFTPGQLVPGFSLRSNLGTGSHGYGTMAFTPPTGGLTSVVVGAMSPASTTLVDFHDGAVAVAMDAFDWQAGTPLSFEVLGEGGRPLGNFTLSGTAPSLGVFAGFISPEPVYRVEVRSLSGASQMISNLRFGGQPGGYSVNSEALHFGATAVGDAVSASVFLQQTGNLPVQLPVLPAGTAPFSIIQDDCSGQLLAVSATCQVSYGYTPTLAQADRLILPLPLANGTPSDTSLLLTGRAVAPHLHLDATSIAFGDLPVGQQATASVVLANHEAVPLQVHSISAASAPFALLAGPDACPPAPFDLDPGEACELTYQVTPTGPEAQRARVLIDSNDPSSPRRLLLQVGIQD
ncbi:MAG: choice-of-anchor D domain-containing protein, partial [Lysobacterales bacterium]